MNISQDQIIQLLESQGNHEQAQQAAQQLPDQVESALMRDELKLAQLEMTRKGKQTGGGEGNDQVVVQAGGHAG